MKQIQYESNLYCIEYLKFTDNHAAKAKHEIDGKINKSRKYFDCRKEITIEKELLSACLTNKYSFKVNNKITSITFSML